MIIPSPPDPTPLAGLRLATAAWSAFFLLVCCVPGIADKSFDFRNRVVSIAHAVISAVLALKLVALRTPLVIGGPNTREQVITLTVSSGYFLYDYAACTLNDARHRKFDAMNFFHHLATLAGLLTGLVTGRSGAELGLCLLLMEVSNPSMHMIHIFRELGMNDSGVAEANKALFALIFTLARILAGPVLTYKTILCPESHVIVKAGALGILVVSLLWFSKIMAMLSKVLGGGGKKEGGGGGGDKGKKAA